MAAGGSKRETLVIWGDQMPSGETEVHPKAEIQRLLATSQPDLVKLAGSSYISAAEAVANAVVGIEDHASKILTIWKGPDADRARTALQLLYATGNELASKLAEMGRSLEGYAASIPVAIAEVEGIKVDQNDPDVQDVLRLHRLTYGRDQEGDEAGVVAMLENMRAQQALRKLNEKIRDLHLGSVPHDITYELPVVAVSAGPLATTNVAYGGAGGTGGTGGSRGAGDPDGTGVSGSGSRSASAMDTPGDEQGAVLPGGEDDADPGTPPADPAAEAGDGSGRQSEGQAGNAGTDTEDGTAPPVIGAQDRTAPDDAGPGADPEADPDVDPGADPSRTETSAYQPAIGDRPSLVARPATSLPPAAAPPAAPPVIGAPNSVYGPGGPLGAMRGGSAAGLSGTPFLPMTAGAGAVGEEGADLERTTYLSEDRSAWNGGHEVTDPVIG